MEVWIPIRRNIVIWINFWLIVVLAQFTSSRSQRPTLKEASNHQWSGGSVAQDSKMVNLRPGAFQGQALTLLRPSTPVWQMKASEFISATIPRLLQDNTWAPWMIQRRQLGSFYWSFESYVTHNSLLLTNNGDLALRYAVSKKHVTDYRINGWIMEREDILAFKRVDSVTHLPTS